MSSDRTGSGSDIHLPVVLISPSDEVSGCEPNMPQRCNPDTMTLQPRVNNARVCLEAETNQITLTDSSPRQERYWNVSGLTNGLRVTGGTAPGAESTHEQK